jgi:DNA-directed RNA polymerase subunit RPC12/RpoP
MTVSSQNRDGQLTTPRFRVLFLGEGNFSFSQAIATFLWHPTTLIPSSNPAARFLNLPQLFAENPEHIQLIATSFDTRDQVVSKYGDGRVVLSNLDRLCAGANKRLGLSADSPDASRVQHSVNAWDLSNAFGDTKFDRIIWNHPHLGTEDFRLHRCLLAHFFASSAAQLLNPTLAGLNEGDWPSVVQVSLLGGQDARWEIVTQAAKGGKFGLLAQKSFVETEFPGYEPKRNKTGQSFKNEKTKKHTGSVMKSWSWCFAVGHKTEEAESELIAEIETKLQLEPTQQPTEASNAATPSPTTTPRFKPPQPQIPRPYTCPHCPRTFPSTRSQSSHIYQIHVLQTAGPTWQAEPELIYECEDCGRKYGAESYLKMHRINKHDKLTPGEIAAIFGTEDEGGNEKNAAEKEDAGYDYVPCDTCGLAVVEREWGMRLHLENLKPVLGLDMQCPRCGSGRKFIERRALWQHVKFCRLKYLDGSTELTGKVEEASQGQGESDGI